MSLLTNTMVYSLRRSTDLELALICWDCASACGHLPISMNSTYLNHDNYVDALFFSPHKMVYVPSILLYVGGRSRLSWCLDPQEMVLYQRCSQ